MTELVVVAALVFITQHFIGFVDFFELFFRFLVPRVAVGVVFHRQLAESLFNFISAGVFVDAQHFVIITFFFTH